MKIAVTDANIFIDLIKTEMLGFLFNLGLEIHTTYEVYNQLNNEQVKFTNIFVQSNSLFLYSFTFEELEELSLLDFPAGLEIADRSVYFYAHKSDALILSGDRKFKKFCERNSKEVKGIIWVFEEIVNKELLPAKIVAEKLVLLLTINTRLPLEECQQRIKKWNAS